MKKVAVMLSGCGVFDGSEIQESVLTLLALSRAGAQYQCLAPDVIQQRVINHYSGKQEASETRNVLVEAARIARGDILDVAEADPADYDALIFPGGFGVVTTLCDFAMAGPDCHIEPAVLKFAQAMAEAKKAVGFICIAPAMIASIYGSGIKVTIGNDPATIEILTAMGNEHIECTVSDYVVDNGHKVVTTPAYMLGKSVADVADGINKLVLKVLELA